MMEEGEYEPVIAFMYQVVYYPFLERSPDDWVKRGIVAHWRERGYHCHLSPDIHSSKGKKVHGVVRMGKKKASNAWHGRIREIQEQIWGVRLLVKASNDGDCPVDQIEVDLGPHVHK